MMVVHGCCVVRFVSFVIFLVASWYCIGSGRGCGYGLCVDSKFAKCERCLLSLKQLWERKLKSSVSIRFMRSIKFVFNTYWYGSFYQYAYFRISNPHLITLVTARRTPKHPYETSLQPKTHSWKPLFQLIADKIVAPIAVHSSWCYPNPS